MSKIMQDFNKYESYIRIGHKADGSDLENFPTPSIVGRGLRDVDLDAYTDLRGYTQRNRVRHDVEQITLGYNLLSPNDEAYILNRISPVWIYVELTDKKTKTKKLCKMYASDKEWNVRWAMLDANGNWYEQDMDFTVTLTEQ
ncbi:MAG: DUF6711 family protein [Clostridia bacterium]